MWNRDSKPESPGWASLSSFGQDYVSRSLSMSKSLSTSTSLKPPALSNLERELELQPELKL
jgi:hypothetical protein